jgi:hypothetical protein
VPFDSHHFEKQAAAGANAPADAIFRDIYRQNHWAGPHSPSGQGASPDQDPLPEADLLLCRDCLVHLSFADIGRALSNVLRSGLPYLLTTTFPECEVNEDIVTGDWRPLNLELEPFGFPPPSELLNERCSEAGGLFADKSLGLWQLAELTKLPFLGCDRFDACRDSEGGTR